MGKPGRRRADLDDYLDLQERLESFKASGLSIDVFCLQEGVSRSAFYRWTRQLKNGLPKSMAAEAKDLEQVQSGAAGFMPVSLTASPVEFELPNGGVIPCTTQRRPRADRTWDPIRPLAQSMTRKCRLEIGSRSSPDPHRRTYPNGTTLLLSQIARVVRTFRLPAPRSLRIPGNRASAGAL